jgi:RNA polymerase sigma-70 factor (ECF subfamily)
MLQMMDDGLVVEELPELRADVVGLRFPFEEFFEAERDRLFGLMFLVTRDRGEAEEIAQDAFLAIWERWDRVHALENPAGYLTRTAMNLFRKRYRRKAALRRILPPARPSDQEGPADSRLMLSEALRGLSPRQRAALVLTELVGYSSEEAASILHVKPTTIGALKYQGRAALRKDAERTDD